MHFMPGIAVGMIIGILMGLFIHHMYLRVLTSIGKIGGFEKIHGKWFKITEVSQEEAIRRRTS